LSWADLTIPTLSAHTIAKVVLRNADLNEVTVTYTVTAHGYGTVFEGKPLAVRVEQVDIFDAVRTAMEASDQS
jgi:hypothetical protein